VTTVWVSISWRPVSDVAGYDVYLNGSAYWKNVPLEVWEYRIGGYQVLKKWLSYREEKLALRKNL